MTITEFLLARIAERESVARDMQHQARVGRPFFRTDLLAGGTGIRELIDPARVMADCEAKRRIVELHKNWPVLIDQPVKLEPIVSSDPTQFAFRASQQIAWATEQEYRAKFGDEPPTAPMLAALAAVYADHPDYREEWRP
ncbi:DUF6221 family protein [Nocardioides terrisoli]|uniref:DUF6221 family protein n=1 Tax=Nocardioides terrisoli TaxID=3388267 RepID=UPI00287B65DE|nr:DUF6221 family protein [Nocardioides marmorisolisilvae]